jgi:hypothetical protein
MLAGTPVLAVAVVAPLIVLVFAQVIALAALRRRRERQDAAALPEARSRMRAALDRQHVADDADAEAIARLPARLRIALFVELAVVLTGAGHERLVSLAGDTGLRADAEARCHSRWWWRRLQGVRLHTLIGGGELCVPGLLRDDNAEVRASVAAWSAAERAPASAGRLIELLGDERPLVRFAAQSALLALERDAVEPLASCLRERDPRILKAVLQVTVGLSDTRLLAPALAHRDDEDPTTRALVAEIAGAVGGEDAVAALLALLADPSPQVRASAAQGLGRLEHWPAGPRLLAALADRAWSVRQRAALALRSLGAPGLLLLRRGLQDADPFARDMARQVLDLPDTDDRAAHA